MIIAELPESNPHGYELLLKQTSFYVFILARSDRKRSDVRSKMIDIDRPLVMESGHREEEAGGHPSPRAARADFATIAEVNMQRQENRIFRFGEGNMASESTGQYPNERIEFLQSINGGCGGYDFLSNLEPRNGKNKKVNKPNANIEVFK